MNNMLSNRMPGVTSERTATPRLTSIVGKVLMPPGFVIDGANARDPLNSPVTELRAGVMLGKITASGKWAPSVIGVTTAAYTSGGTTLSVSPATAVELVRRLGASSGTGTIVCVGPPTAGGTVAATAVTFSAIDTSTGDITVTSLGVNKVTGCFITLTDGSETIRGIFLGADGYPVKMVDEDGTSRDVSCDKLLVGCDWMDPTEIINWPADASLKSRVKAALRLYGHGWVFKDDYV